MDDAYSDELLAQLRRTSWFRAFANINNFHSRSSSMGGTSLDRSETLPSKQLLDEYGRTAPHLFSEYPEYAPEVQAILETELSSVEKISKIVAEFLRTDGFPSPHVEEASEKKSTENTSPLEEDSENNSTKNTSLSEEDSESASETLENAETEFPSVQDISEKGAAETEAERTDETHIFETHIAEQEPTLDQDISETEVEAECLDESPDLNEEVSQDDANKEVLAREQALSPVEEISEKEAEAELAKEWLDMKDGRRDNDIDGETHVVDQGTPLDQRSNLEQKSTSDRGLTEEEELVLGSDSSAEQELTTNEEPSLQEESTPEPQSILQHGSAPESELIAEQEPHQELELTTEENSTSTSKSNAEPDLVPQDGSAVSLESIAELSIEPIFAILEQESTAEPPVEPEPTEESSMEPQPTEESSIEPEMIEESSVGPELIEESSMEPDSIEEPSTEPESIEEPSMEPEPMTEEPDSIAELVIETESTNVELELNTELEPCPEQDSELDKKPAASILVSNRHSVLDQEIAPLSDSEDSVPDEQKLTLDDVFEMEAEAERMEGPQTCSYSNIDFRPRANTHTNTERSSKRKFRATDTTGPKAHHRHSPAPSPAPSNHPQGMGLASQFRRRNHLLDTKKARRERPSGVAVKCIRTLAIQRIHDILRKRAFSRTLGRILPLHRHQHAVENPIQSVLTGILLLVPANAPDAVQNPVAGIVASIAGLIRRVAADDTFADPLERIHDPALAHAVERIPDHGPAGADPFDNLAHLADGVFRFAVQDAVEDTGHDAREASHGAGDHDAERCACTCSAAVVHARKVVVGKRKGRAMRRIPERNESSRRGWDCQVVLGTQSGRTTPSQRMQASRRIHTRPRTTTTEARINQDTRKQKNKIK
ncbi:hypothetical protein PMIN03_009812 [Paraphaeosphaeria minitans]